MGLSLDESARRAGANRWIEARLFEVAGGWVPLTAEPGVGLMLDRHSRHHAWRAAQWWDRLPVLADVDRADLCRPPTDGWAAALDHLAAIETTAGRLAALYRAVLPRLHTRYDRLHHEADDRADGSTRRTVVIVRTDLAADWHEGEGLLEQILDTQGAEAVGFAFGAAAGVEAFLAG
jgi:hypothetical protein